jgi:predicted O-methyltransferase YrrM
MMTDNNRRVFDCLLYNGELHVLEIRLHELHSVVDRFVIVESDSTFSGNPKQIEFDPTHPAMAPFAHKIDHVIVSDMPKTDNPWEREAWQRNAMLRGVGAAADYDLILMSDVDEIPRAEIVASARDDENHTIFFFRLSFYYFFLNFKNITGPEVSKIWNCAAIRSEALRIGPQSFRNILHPGARVFEDAGWHFSYLTDEAGIKRKVTAFSHQELNTASVLAKIDISALVQRGADLYDRPGYQWELTDGSDLPQWVKDNLQRLAGLFNGGISGAMHLDYEFTSDWFSTNINAWNAVFSQTGVAPSKVLEIGSYEGRSTVWIIENLLTRPGSSLVAVDTWAEGDEAHLKGMNIVEARFDRNISIAKQRHPAVQLEKRKGQSAECLSALVAEGRKESFDFIYVDGSHEAPDVLTDLVFAFHLCKPGGLIFCDDYLGAMDRELVEAPKLAIDSFFACFHRKLRIIPERFYQLYLLKIAN